MEEIARGIVLAVLWLVIIGILLFQGYYFLEFILDIIKFSKKGLLNKYPHLFTVPAVMRRLIYFLTYMATVALLLRLLRF